MKNQVPLSNRSQPKSLSLKIAGGILLAVGAVFALFGLAIVRALFFDWLEKSETIDSGRVVFAAFCAVLAVVGVLLGEMGWRVFRRGRKFSALSAEEILEKDPRPPVVYIRSFREDNKLLTRADKTDLWVSRFFMPIFSVASKEEILAKCLSEIGPVVAIGNPREELPELGAARMYFSDDEWQANILKFMERARLVVLLGGPTKNLWWEIEQAVKKLPPEKLICLTLEAKNTDNHAFERDFEEKIGQPGAISKVALSGQKGSRFLRDYGKIIFFGKNWSPQVSIIRGLPPRMAFYNQTINQFGPALRVALRPVFAQLGLPAPRLPLNRWSVFIVLLAVVGMLLFGYLYFFYS